MNKYLDNLSFNLFKNIRGVVEFKSATKNPALIQKKVLKRILSKNAKTMYGEKYNFKNIKSIKDYQLKVPIISYEDLTNYIDLLKIGEQNILTKDRVIYFATTSGTTKNVKLIPITKERTRIFKTELLLWSTFFLKKNKEVIKGKMLYFAGPYYEFYTKAGIPCGSISGYLAHKTPWFIKKRLAFSPKVYNIMNFDEKTKIIAINALQSNITQMGFASPIEAILFFDYLKKNKLKLINILKKKGKTKRAKALQKINNFIPINIWPNLKLINCIKSKSNQIYLDSLREKIGKQNIKIRDPGIYSSEGRLSLCIDDSDSVSGVIPANENFFEFIEQKNGKSIGAPLTVDKIKKGKEYLVIITTPEGLYRYDMGDVVKVSGFIGLLPLIEFVNRNNFLNIAGELAHENILIESIQLALTRTNSSLRGFTVIPLIHGSKKPRYEVLIEFKNKTSEILAKRLVKEIDDSLQENISDYKQMRNEFGRLDPPVVSVLQKGSYDEFEKKRVVRGGQPKPIYMSKDSKFRDNFKIEKTFN
ncbi:MAG: GH3 auxin-responsive promoter family protein [Candidatus Woesearchaeota archaeon]|jgi:hypothetical protein